MNDFQKIIESRAISATAPCRIDMGGTLDIGSFYYPLSYLNPCTFNIAVDMRTRIDIVPYRPGYVRISSRGFDDAEYPADALPFKHPLGLMFAIAAYFHMDGIHINIVSTSPPRSALGGSSAAAVALIAAFNRVLTMADHPGIPMDRIPLLAHAIEEGVAGVPCGLQDQLAATYGGINAWHWRGKGADALYRRQQVVDKAGSAGFRHRLLLAYCGVPHESVNINSQWVTQVTMGGNYSMYQYLCRCHRGRRYISSGAADEPGDRHPAGNDAGCA
jgi:D-glycero-alpha-D-manno-heptose-7-phosphate kinase